MFIIKNFSTGEIVFQIESETDMVLDFEKCCGADLRGADLTGADLRGVGWNWGINAKFPGYSPSTAAPLRFSGTKKRSFISRVFDFFKGH